MKRRKAAGAGFAGLLLLALVIWLGSGTGTTAPSEGDSRAPSPGQAVDGRSAPVTGDKPHHPARSPRATLALPAIKTGQPTAMRLTRETLEHAWQAGKLVVSVPDGGGYTVALEDQRFDAGGQWTVVGRVKTRLGAQAMVLTFGPDAVFGVLPRPDGSLLQVTTTRGNTEIAMAGGMLPPGRKSRLATEPDYLIPPQGQQDRKPKPCAAPAGHCTAKRHVND